MTERAYRRITRLPMVKWSAAIMRLNPEDRHELEDRCTREAIQLARLGEYVTCRGGDGCGDGGHTFAVKLQNRRAAKVRSAIGYTQAIHDVNFGEE